MAAVSAFCCGHGTRCIVAPNLAKWLFLHSLTLIKAYSVSKWLEVFRLIFAYVTLPFLHSCYITDAFKSALHIFRQGKYDYIRCQWKEGLGTRPRVTLSINHFADVWCLVEAHKPQIILFHGTPRSPEIQFCDWIYKIQINKFNRVIEKKKTHYIDWFYKFGNR